ncbi:MAG: DUF1062 domain-containing protein [Bacillota bacterium]|nr:DUF1062 domain-containing protein [Bacillota bacterium]
MQIVNWDIVYTSPPPVIRYCSKCGKKSEYISTSLFRVNAQRRYLDIWLIYKCSDCDSTWNMSIYTRINPKSIAPDILEGFLVNNTELAEKYAMDIGLIQRNGAQAGLPKYKILKSSIDFTVPFELHIKSPFPSRLKVSSILREILNLSQKSFEQILENQLIKSVNRLDLRKCRVQDEIVLIITECTDIKNAL